MTKRDFLDWVEEVEQNHDVSAWRMAGLRIWPMVRLTMFAENFGAQVGAASTQASRSQQIRMAARMVGGALRTRMLDAASQQRPDEPADVVFLAESIGSQPVIEGKRFNPLLAPWAELAERLGRSVSVWESAPFGDVNIPRATPSHLIQSRVLMERLRHQYGRVAVESNLDGYAGFLENAGRVGLRSRYGSEAALARDAAFVRALADTFGSWLRSTGASHGVVADYSARDYAFCVACHESGVVPIEIQHGVQGPLHPAYARWSVEPPDGWEMRPRRFCSWDRVSAETINSWASYPGDVAAVVTGNPWREVFRDGDSPIARYATREVERLKDGSDAPVVLITTDYVGAVLPPSILRAIAEAPAEWRFWIRLHPVNQRESRKDAVRALAAAGLTERVALEAPTALPLHALLRAIDLHITVTWSTVALEAAEWGVRSVACGGELAAEVFAEQVEKGIVAISQGDDLLLRCEQQMARGALDPIVDAPDPVSAFARVLNV